MVSGINNIDVYMYKSFILFNIDYHLSNYPLIVTLEKRYVKAGVYKAAISHINSIDSFYIQMQSEETDLINLMKYLEISICPEKLELDKYIRGMLNIY